MHKLSTHTDKHTEKSQLVKWILQYW